MLLKSKEQVEEFIKERNIQHFEAEEFLCKCGCGKVLIESQLITTLEALREHIQKPVVITSAYRCPSWNKQVGGVSSSAHTRGLAVDIECTNSKDRYLILKFLLSRGVERIGIGRNFVHFDLDDEKPSPRVWHYYYEKR
ncbi:MAG: peptidase M15 [Aquifex sp.]|nr:MAG: peptidase M15 [Aquifex sp.]